MTKLKEIYKYVRAIIAGLCLIGIAFSVLFANEAPGLNHPHWCRFFSILFLFVLWASITFIIGNEDFANIKKQLLDSIPAFDVNGLINFLLLTVFVTPAFWILIDFIRRVVIALQAGGTNPAEDEMLMWLGMLPGFGELLNAEIITSLLDSDFTIVWEGVISITYTIIILFISILFISIIAKIFAGALCRYVVFRVITGLAMMIYVLYLPEWILAIVDGTFLDINNIQKIFLTIDRAPFLLMLIGYILLIGITATICSYIIWPIMLGVCFFMLVAIFPSIIDFINNNIEHCFLFLALYGIARQVWELAPNS